MTLDAFVTVLRHLRALRLGPMLQAGIWRELRQPELGAHFHRFRSNPALYMLDAEPEVRERIWRMVTDDQPRAAT